MKNQKAALRGGFLIFHGKGSVGGHPQTRGRETPAPRGRLFVWSYRKGEGEGGALVGGALGLDGAAVHFYQAFGDGEAEARATGGAGAGLVGPVEAVENVGY